MGKELARRANGVRARTQSSRSIRPIETISEEFAMPFTVTIDTTKIAFGENEHQARTKICYLLEQIGQIIGSGRDPQPPLPADGEVVGEYTLDLQDKQPRVPRRAIDQGAIDKINAT